MKLYIVYNNNLNHIDICKKGYGASEFQFYMLAKKLANHNFDVTVFNQSNINNTIDNITYRKYSDIFNGINIELPDYFDITIRTYKTYKEWAPFTTYKKGINNIKYRWVGLKKLKAKM